jgi:hypothetical protein
MLLNSSTPKCVCVTVRDSETRVTRTLGIRKCERCSNGELSPESQSAESMKRYSAISCRKQLSYFTAGH